jgi:hypothetical protein
MFRRAVSSQEIGKASSFPVRGKDSLNLLGLGRQEIRGNELRTQRDLYLMSRATEIIPKTVLLFQYLGGGGLIRHPVMKKRTRGKTFAIGHRDTPLKRAQDTFPIV